MSASLAAEAPLQVASPCSLANEPAKSADWVRTWSPHFPVEKSGALIRVPKPSAAINELTRQTARYPQDRLQIVPCGSFVLLWLPCNGCDSYDSEIPWLKEDIGPHELLHYFDYNALEMPQDCLSGRLPKHRCARAFRSLSKIKDCNASSQAQRRMNNQLLIHLDLEPPGSRACLWARDLNAVPRQPKAPASNEEDIRIVDPLLR
jgi:hypothetical protein